MQAENFGNMVNIDLFWADVDRPNSPQFVRLIRPNDLLALKKIDTVHLGPLRLYLKPFRFLVTK